jgi:hypothetical protein
MERQTEPKKKVKKRASMIQRPPFSNVIGTARKLGLVVVKVEWHTPAEAARQ